MSYTINNSADSKSHEMNVELTFQEQRLPEPCRLLDISLIMLHGQYNLVQLRVSKHVPRGCLGGIDFAELSIAQGHAYTAVSTWPVAIMTAHKLSEAKSNAGIFTWIKTHDPSPSFIRVKH